MMNTLPVSAEPNGIVPADGSNDKILQISAHSTQPDEYEKMLATAVQMLNVADAVTKIQKGVEYVVQVPAQFQSALQEGTVGFMHGAGSGKTSGI